MLEAWLAHIRNFQPVGKYGTVSPTQNPAKAHRNYPGIIPERILAGTDRFIKGAVPIPSFSVFIDFQ